MPARVAMAFAKADSQVYAMVPRGSPIEKVRSVKRTFYYSAVAPLDALVRVINIVQPDVIIPCDDRVVKHLHLLHARSSHESANEELRSLIEKSIGAPMGYPLASSRGRIVASAKALGIRVPETAVVQDLQQLKAWLSTHGYPAVIKVDGTWGGTGVRIVRSWEEAEMAFVQLTAPVSIMGMLRLASIHDFYPLFSQHHQTPLNVTVQAYIDGYSANSMCACWTGEVLDQLSVKTLFSVDPLGSSTIVKTISHVEMHRACTVIVKHLGLSGFCGLDFIIDKRSGTPYLIELNPRVTQLGHLQIAERPSLVNTLNRRLLGEAPRGGAPIPDETIAFFPHILRCIADDPALGSPNIRYDIPWEEPELIGELMRKPWNGRHLSYLVYKVITRLIEGVKRPLGVVMKKPVFAKLGSDRLPNEI